MLPGTGTVARLACGRMSVAIQPGVSKFMLVNHSSGTTLARQDHGGVKSAARVLDILELFREAEGDLGLTEVARKLSLPKSSAHGLVNTLVARGYLHFHPDTRSYSLGIHAWNWAGISPPRRAGSAGGAGDGAHRSAGGGDCSTRPAK